MKNLDYICTLLNSTKEENVVNFLENGNLYLAYFDKYLSDAEKNESRYVGIIINVKSNKVKVIDENIGNKKEETILSLDHYIRHGAITILENDRTNLIDFEDSEKLNTSLINSVDKFDEVITKRLITRMYSSDRSLYEEGYCDYIKRNTILLKKLETDRITSAIPKSDKINIK